MQSKACFLVEDPVDLFYLTGVKLSRGMLFIAPNKSCLFVDGRYLELAQSQKKVAVDQSDEKRERAFLKAQKCDLLLFDSAKTSCERRKELKKRLGVSLRAKPYLLRQPRSIKSLEEIEKLKKSAQLGYAGYQYLLTLLKEGVSERELAVAFHCYCLDGGAEKASFEPIIAFGKNGALPHHRPGSTLLRKGDAVLFDLGVQLEGYVSDMTRVHFFGAVPPVIQKWDKWVKEAYRVAVALCRPGVTIGELDQAARAVFAREGVEELFVHSLGHGLGLEVHEFPLVRRTGPDSRIPLEEGMVITIEPGLYRPGTGGIRYEDTLLITKDGFENFYPDEAR